MNRLVACILSMLVLLGCPAPTTASDAPAVSGPALDRMDLVRILDVEWSRGDPARIDPFLTRPPGSAARRRALLALGRIGDRPGVETRLRALLRGLQSGVDADLDAIAHAAGLTGLASLVPDLLPHLPRERDPKAEATRGPASAALVAVVEAVGRLADPRASGYLRPFVADADPVLAKTALYALMRLGDETSLETVAAALDAKELEVVRAAAFTTWRLVGARRKARGGDTWPGEPARADDLARRAAATGDAATRIALLRGIASALPRGLVSGEGAPGAAASRALLDALRDASPQVAGDVAFRLGVLHEGAATRDALSAAAAHADPLVREAALDALEAQPGDEGRVTYLLAVERTASPQARAEVEALFPAPSAEGSPLATPEDTPAVRRHVRSLLSDAATPAHARVAALLARADLPRALRIAVLDAATKPAAKAPGVFTAAAEAAARDADPVLRGVAVTLLITESMADEGPQALVRRVRAAEVAIAAYGLDSGPGAADARAMILDAIGEHKAEGAAHAPLAALVERGLVDVVVGVRRAARKALARRASADPRLALPDPVANDWKGLPRPRTPVLGLDLRAGGPWLATEEVLRVAEAAREVVVVIETDRGAIRVRLDVEAAPAHAASLVLAASANVYGGTPWHRVVPAFVIQGGDPRGDGSGDAGWSVPDEITSRSFVRGVLGAPKSTKDTAGCQVFLMHVASPHLDGAYTAYGVTTDDASAAVIDAIRVGDRILGVRLEGP